MSFEQIVEILDALQTAHGVVRVYCATHESDFSDERHQLTISALQEDQRAIESALAQYGSDPRAAPVTGTWIQYVPHNALLDSVERITVMESPRFDELAVAISHFYGVAMEYVQRVKEQAQSERANKLLDELGELERQKAIALSKRIAGLRDM